MSAHTSMEHYVFNEKPYMMIGFATEDLIFKLPPLPLRFHREINSFQRSYVYRKIVCSIFGWPSIQFVTQTTQSFHLGDKPLVT